MSKSQFIISLKRSSSPICSTSIASLFTLLNRHGVFCFKSCFTTWLKFTKLYSFSPYENNIIQPLLYSSKQKLCFVIWSSLAIELVLTSLVLLPLCSTSPCSDCETAYPNSLCWLSASCWLQHKLFCPHPQSSPRPWVCLGSLCSCSKCVFVYDLQFCCSSIPLSCLMVSCFLRGFHFCCLWGGFWGIRRKREEALWR